MNVTKLILIITWLVWLFFPDAGDLGIDVNRKMFEVVMPITVIFLLVEKWLSGEDE